MSEFPLNLKSLFFVLLDFAGKQLELKMVSNDRFSLNDEFLVLSSDLFPFQGKPNILDIIQLNTTVAIR